MNVTCVCVCARNGQPGKVIDQLTLFFSCRTQKSNLLLKKGKGHGKVLYTVHFVPAIYTQGNVHDHVSLLISS